VINHYGFDDKQVKQADAELKVYEGRLKAFLGANSAEIDEYEHWVTRQEENAKDRTRQLASLQKHDARIASEARKLYAQLVPPLDGLWKDLENDLNAIAKFDVKGATDVTGFALLGHAWEMACASNVTIEIDSASVPLINGALELVEAGMLTGADKTNREYVGEDVSIAESLDPNLVKLFYDPQTAGGLLLAVPQEKADELLEELRPNYPRAQIIGRVRTRTEQAIMVM